MVDEVTSELRVYMRHLRMAHQCSRGARDWFASNGLDWSDFVTNGVPVSVLEAIGDPIAIRPVLAAKTEAAMEASGGL